MVKMLEETPASRMSNDTPPQVRNFDNSFIVRWGGSSPLLSAVTFDIFVSDNGGPFTPFQAATTATSVNFKGVPGHTYGFFSIATDALGNREPMKTRAEIMVQVLDPTPRSSVPRLLAHWVTMVGIEAQLRQLERLRSRVRHCILHRMRANQPDCRYSGRHPYVLCKQRRGPVHFRSHHHQTR